ncbi:MAG: hypothetical protein ACE14O_07205, partial [Candidatus Cloacimonadaceae bacterium]
NNRMQSYATASQIYRSPFCQIDFMHTIGYGGKKDSETLTAGKKDSERFTVFRIYLISCFINYGSDAAVSLGYLRGGYLRLYRNYIRKKRVFTQYCRQKLMD